MPHIPGRLRVLGATRLLCTATNQSSSLRASEEYCANLVRQSDFENYLAGLLVPKKNRGAYFAVRAFNVELATIKDQMHGNAVAGRIRFQWWRDVIDGIFENGDGNKLVELSKHPVPHALAHYSRACGFSKHWLERSLEARQRDTMQVAYETLDELEMYAEHGHSSILYLLLESLDVRDDDSKFLASHIGVCSGLSTLLRGFPHLVSQRQIYIPREIMQKNSITDGQILAMTQGLNASGAAEIQNSHKKALHNCIFDVASQAHGHKDRAKELFAKSRTASNFAINICAPLLRSMMFLEALQGVGFDPFHPALQKNEQLQYQLKLLRMRYFGGGMT